MNNLFADNGDNTGDIDLHDNFTSILYMVQESLSEVERARLVQALMARPKIGEVTSCTWMLNAHRLLTQAVQIMSQDQLERWAGWKVAIEEMPIREVQRLENLNRLCENSSVEYRFY